VVAVLYVPMVARVMRSMVLDLKDKEFVEAARVRGERRSYVLFGRRDADAGRLALRHPVVHDASADRRRMLLPGEAEMTVGTERQSPRCRR
jgi:hypothetical protein